VGNIAGSVGVSPAGSVSGFPDPCTIASPGDPVPHVNDADANVAQADVTPAYDALAAMPCGISLTDQDLGGMVLAPGVYCFTSSAQLTGNLELAGPANGLWVFQVATALTTGTSAEVLLSGGADAKNVFWQVGSSATLGQTTIFKGNIIAAVSVTMVQGSSLVGRALSKAGITMDDATITLP
jgi:type VI secretion system secreted protein VgrG